MSTHPMKDVGLIPAAAGTPIDARGGHSAARRRIPLASASAAACTWPAGMAAALFLWWLSTANTHSRWMSGTALDCTTLTSRDHAAGCTSACAKYTVQCMPSP